MAGTTHQERDLPAHQVGGHATIGRTGASSEICRVLRERGAAWGRPAPRLARDGPVAPVYTSSGSGMGRSSKTGS
jgi:hypothetical protein